MKFHKYQGTGNDFIMIDGRNDLQLSTEKIQQLCNRNFGIGSDGLLIIRNNSRVDFTMEFYNPDGSVASFCGNGARCIVKFAQELKIIDKICTFEAKDELHKAKIVDQNIDLQMIDIEKYEYHKNNIFLNTGTQHLVKFVNNVNDIQIMTEAPALRYDKYFEPHGPNVNFVEESKTNIKIRTYEKGVEAETLSCGTGVTAAAIAYAIKNNISKSTVNVQTKGGNLQVSFEKNNEKFTNIHLIGNAIKVFEGEID